MVYALLGACIAGWTVGTPGIVQATPTTDASGNPAQPVAVELREPLSVRDAVRLVDAANAQPAEFVAHYRVGRQVSTAGYTLEGTRRSTSADAVADGLGSVVAAAALKIRQDHRLPAATRDRWLDDHAAAMHALQHDQPLISKLKVRASDTAIQRLRADKSIASVTVPPAGRRSTSPAAPASPRAAAAEAAGAVPWWPYAGHIETTCCWGAGNRGVYQAMVWTQARLDALKAARGDPSNVGYEADAVYYNGDGATYLAETISWGTNLPDAYLDTQFADPQEFKVRTIGTADAAQMTANSTNPLTGDPEGNYYTLIVSADGEAATDTATVKGTVVHRAPESCHEAICQFSQDDIPSHYFIPNQAHQVPGLTPYPCEAAVEGYCDPYLDGPPVLMTIELSGQQRSFAFTGTVGLRVSLGFTGNTFTQNVNIRTFKPDGVQLSSMTLLAGSKAEHDLPALPVDGTYRVRLTPGASDIGAVTVTLSSAVLGSITIDGPTAVATIPRFGQDAYVEFQGTAGQRLSIGFSGSSFGDYLDTTVYAPSGASVSSGLRANGMDSDLSPLPATGTYRILLDPKLQFGSGTGSITLTLSSVVNASISVNGGPVSVVTSRAGQDVWLDFQGTAGQALRITFGLNTMGNSVDVTVYQPDGAVLKHALRLGNDSLDLPALPATGTYRIRLDPDMFPSQGVGGITLTLSTI